MHPFATWSSNGKSFDFRWTPSNQKTNEWKEKFSTLLTELLEIIIWWKFNFKFIEFFNTFEREFHFFEKKKIVSQFLTLYEMKSTIKVYAKYTQWTIHNTSQIRIKGNGQESSAVRKCYVLHTKQHTNGFGQRQIYYNAACVHMNVCLSVSTGALKYSTNATANFNIQFITKEEYITTITIITIRVCVCVCVWSSVSIHVCVFVQQKQQWYGFSCMNIIIVFDIIMLGIYIYSPHHLVDAYVCVVVVVAVEIPSSSCFSNQMKWNEM